MLYQLSYAHHIAFACARTGMAHPAGLEPATIRLEGGCSIQLSYGRLYLHTSERRLQAPANEVSFKSRLTQQQAVLDKRGES